MKYLKTNKTLALELGAREMYVKDWKNHSNLEELPTWDILNAFNVSLQVKET